MFSWVHFNNDVGEVIKLSHAPKEAMGYQIRERRGTDVLLRRQMDSPDG